MSIQRASEHAGTRSVYCSFEDVETFLTGVATDDDDQVFASLLSSAQLRRLVEKYLVIA